MIVGARSVARATAVTAALWLASAAIVAQGTSDRPQMAEEVFKNVQLLKGIPVDQFMGTMGLFSASTGLNCTDCHLDESGGNWAKYADDNARKQMTRRMMQMVDTINQTNFGGRQVVTCFTCHRGASRPSVMPSIDLAVQQPAPVRAWRSHRTGARPALGRRAPRQVHHRARWCCTPRAAERLYRQGQISRVRRCREEPDGAVCRCAGASNCCQPHCVG